MNKIVNEGMAGLEMVVKWFGVVGKAVEFSAITLLGVAVVIVLLPFAALYWCCNGLDS